jgi:hypothetical protein
MVKNTRYMWYDEHLYEFVPGLQAPDPVDFAICGEDIPRKTIMRGYIYAEDVAGENKACKKCKKVVDRLLSKKV